MLCKESKTGKDKTLVARSFARNLLLSLRLNSPSTKTTLAEISSLSFKNVNSLFAARCEIARIEKSLAWLIRRGGGFLFIFETTLTETFMAYYMPRAFFTAAETLSPAAELQRDLIASTITLPNIFGSLPASSTDFATAASIAL